jgi:hypothetical protein
MRRTQRTHTAWMRMRDEETDSASHLHSHDNCRTVLVLDLQYFCFNSAGFLCTLRVCLLSGGLRRMERSIV